MKTPEQIARQTLRDVFAFPSRPDGAALRGLIVSAIEADRAQRSYYLLSFEPDAIREHFEVDEEDPTEGMTDEQLEAVALEALSDDRLYSVFHELLSEGVGA